MSRKTININPLFLKNPEKSKKKQKRNTRKTNTSSSHDGAKLRTKLLNKIKDHKQKQNNKQNVILDNNDNLNDFNKSMNYLQEIATKQHNKRNNKKSKKKQKVSNQPVSNHSVSNQPVSNHSVSNHSVSNQPVSNQPAYSCLKNGSRPTYRTWKNLQKNPSKLKINTDALPKSPETSRSKELQKLKHEFKKIPPNLISSNTTPNLHTSDLILPPPPAPPLSPPPISLQPFSLAVSNDDKCNELPVKKSSMAKTKKCTTHKLGKQGNQVAVLIKDRYTRKKIKHEHRLLKRKSMLEVKKYLKEHQLLKAGSAAPNDVLRATYEQAILTGEVNNKGDKTLIHNYLSKN